MAETIMHLQSLGLDWIHNQNKNLIVAYIQIVIFE